MDWSLMDIEIATAVLGLGLLVLGLIVPHNARRGLGWLTVLGLAGILALSIGTWSHQGSLYGGMYIVDSYSTFFKEIFLTAAILVTLGSMRYVDEQVGYQAEYYGILVFATLGMMVMASAGDFITLYLGLELMTIAFIILVALRKTDGKSVEAGIKYVLLAGLSSAVLLFGLSLVYGLTGTVNIIRIALLLSRGAFPPVLILGLVLLVAGLGFKISAVPFHMWAPDVYEGAPTPITAFLGTGSKAASFAVVLRLFTAGFSGVWANWTLMVAILAAVTMVVGNLVAIPQTNIKRLLAYSSVAQAGYILVGVVTASPAGVKAVLFYAFIYVFATVGAFTVVANVFAQTGSDEIRDYAGLSQRSPLSAAMMLFALLSMAGIPPLAGFAGKFYLFATVIQGYPWLAVIGLVMSMVSVYYYLRVVLVMYRDEPLDPSPITLSSPVALTMVIAMVATLVIGFYPGPLANVTDLAARSFFVLR
ncbi:MAG: NADH-quinone oxidoreductase subunit N [Peptococcaceae bacterium]|jgi:NADH-quinone oxidoreductase subunit N|nr:NADH-quinone oxidoreductase subunit N [Peptococcaceae bacterium]